MYQKVANQILALGCMTSTQVSNYCHHVLNCVDKSAGGFITQAKKTRTNPRRTTDRYHGEKGTCVHAIAA